MVEGHYVLEYQELTYHVMNKSGSTMARYGKTKVTPMILRARARIVIGVDSHEQLTVRNADDWLHTPEQCGHDSTEGAFTCRAELAQRDT